MKNYSGSPTSFVVVKSTPSALVALGSLGYVHVTPSNFQDHGVDPARCLTTKYRVSGYVPKDFYSNPGGSDLLLADFPDIGRGFYLVNRRNGAEDFVAVLAAGLVP